jgi:glycosyltransferase involved in cell wall biosynthesis
METESQVERPRVLIVTPQPFYEDRGTPIAVQYVARALSELGIDVDLLAFPLGREVNITNVTLKRCANLLRIRRVPIGFSWKKLVLDASLWKSFSRLLARRRYDMVHAVEEAAYIAAAICPRFNQPFVYDMASAIPMELRRQRLLSSRRVQSMLQSVERWVLDRATQVVCSPGLGGYVRAQAPRAPVTEWRFPALRPQVSELEMQSLRERLRVTRDRRIVLYSGSFAGYQGIDLLLEAFVQARRTHPELLLVCVGATESEMEVWSKRIPADLAEDVRLVPRQPRERIAAYIGLADFLALPRGRTDNIPLKLFDYMASGKPIIAVRQAAYAPLLDQTRAFICDPTPEALARALSRACRFPEEARSVAQESLRYARAQFGWAGFVEFVRHTYAQSIFIERASAQLAEAS